jgi:hypothetical protein
MHLGTDQTWFHGATVVSHIPLQQREPKSSTGKTASLWHRRCRSSREEEVTMGWD